VVGAGLIAQRYSRSAELEADRYGTRYMHRAGYNPEGAVDLMDRFVALSEGRQESWLNGLFASHPPSRERVEANRRLAERLGADGEWGGDRFMAATRKLRANEPAYETAQQAREQIEAGNLDEAMRLARQARRAVPDEPRFLALTGDIHHAAKRSEQALTDYRQAAETEPGYFQHHLMIGLLEADAGNDGVARQALKRSIDRLPTAPAHLHLGHIERRAGNRNAAIQQYRIAAQSDSPSGEQARQALEEMGATSTDG
jgi:predicted Zn-dependent protease